MKTSYHGWRLVPFLVLLCLFWGCAAVPESGPRAWIDAPMDGSSVALGTPVPVVSHAYAKEGVAEVLLSVNGQAYQRSKTDRTGSFGKAEHEWNPQQEGDYVLEVKALTANGATSPSAAVRVRVIGRATPVVDVSPTAVRAGAPDLVIDRVDAVIAGYKGETPFCNTRVVYRNAGDVAVPDPFTIQFHFNGTPRLANTVAGGLAPGASTEAVFVYQFDGMPYIGINLDSTNVIAESDETNNAFANARLCGGTPPAAAYTPTPVSTWTPTRPPTVRLPVISLTPTPVPTPTFTPLPAATVNFRADKTTLNKGECTILRWDVDNATAVFLDGQGVNGHATTKVCPTKPTIYTLHVEGAAGSVDRTVSINIAADNNPPPVPTPQVPANGLVISCKTTQTLAWLPVTDPSGIAGYYVHLDRQVTANSWQAVRDWGPVVNKQVTANVQCGVKYRWAVRATDGAGNSSEWSSWFAFSISLD